MKRNFLSFALILRTWFARDVWSLALFGSAAALAMYPTLSAVRWHVIGWPGDNVQYVYMTGWVAHALRNGLSPFIDSRLNYPDTLSLATTDTPFLSMMLVAPVTWLFTPTLGYNLILFLSHALSGYFTYLWCQRLTGSRFAGNVAGLIFLLTPYRIAHSYGHLQIISTQFIPPFFWILDEVLRTQRPSRFHWLLLGSLTFLVGSMAQYYLVICGTAALCYVWLARPTRQYLMRYGWVLALAMGLGAALSALPYLAVWRDAGFQSYRIEETRVWSASVFDFFAPSRLHPIWGVWIEQIYPRATWIEHTLYLGAAALILALLALLWRLSPYAYQNRLWLSMVLFGLVMALGTDLHVNGQPLQAQEPIWLPAYYFAHVPLANLVRSWARFAIVSILFVALLAGLGAAILQKHFQWRAPAMALCLALVLVDLLPGRIEFFSLQPRAIDDWLAAQPGNYAVAFLPAGVDNYLAMYGSLFHQKRLPAYNHPTHIPDAFKVFATETAKFPEPATLMALQQMNLRYVLLQRASFNGVNAADWRAVESALTQASGWRIITEVGGFVIVAPPNAP